MTHFSWFQRVKDKEFESNSQRTEVVTARMSAGFSVSKIKNLKAIHNIDIVDDEIKIAGFSVSKIKNLKAIHNPNVETSPTITLVSACQR